VQRAIPAASPDRGQRPTVTIRASVHDVQFTLILSVGAGDACGADCILRSLRATLIAGVRCRCR